MIGYINNMKGTHVIMSTFKLSWEEPVAMQPCSLSTRAMLFAGRKSLSVRQALNAGVSISDLLWVADKLRKTKQIVEFAKACADHVHHLENYYSKRAVVYAADAAADAAVAAAYADAVYADAVYADAVYADAAERKFQQQLFIKIFA